MLTKSEFEGAVKLKAAVEKKASEPPVAGAAGGSEAIKRRYSQCDCCATPLGESVRVGDTTRTVCDKCLGFLFRWLLELEAADEKPPNNEVERPAPVSRAPETERNNR